jgi:hypothetical protein
MVVMWTGIAVIGVVLLCLLVVRFVNMGVSRPRLNAADKRSNPPVSQDGAGNGPLF